MKRFMFLSIGLLCLALALLIGFEIGGQRAEAQTGPEIVGFSTVNIGGTWSCFVCLQNGDVYYRGLSTFEVPYVFVPDQLPLHPVGNFWGSPVSTDKATLGKLKGQYGK